MSLPLRGRTTIRVAFRSPNVACLCASLAEQKATLTKRLLVLLVLCVSSGGSAARAGLGPQHVLVVVNADSIDSRTVANHYIHLRQIPSINVLHLHGIPRKSKISLAEFRDAILKPTVTAITQRNLGNQIRSIAYSCDFPIAVDIGEHQQRIAEPNLRRLMTPTGSLTGLTFHFRHILEDSEGYLGPTTNWYARMPFDRYFTNPFVGDDADAFTAAQQAAKEAKHAEAAKQYADLFRRHAEHHPIAIMAAEQYAAAAQLDESQQMLDQAVAAGWTSGEYLAQSPLLAPLAQRDAFTALLQPLSTAPIDVQPTVGFAGHQIWTPSGIAATSGVGMNYQLAVMLAVTGESGMTVSQAVANLARSASADRTHPDGLVYFAKTSDVRTTTRSPGFVAAIGRLSHLGRRSRVIRTALPQQGEDAVGVTIGAAGFRWKDSATQLVPGAIADNLTSFGAVMDQGGQTKLTELLQAGAAMSSGTVAEPYAVQIKFPDPMVHAHYAAGVTAAEAFYQSVLAPYQLLIAGDPLCQPFATPPSDRPLIRITKPERPWELELDVEPAIADGAAGGTDGRPAGGEPVAASRADIFVGGRWAGEYRLAGQQRAGHQEAGAGEGGRGAAAAQPASRWPVRLGLDTLPDGAYEIRVSLVADTAAAASREATEWIEVQRQHALPAATVVDDAAAQNAARGRSRDVVKVRVQAEGADAVQLHHFGTQLGASNGPAGEFDVTVAKCGRGPVRLTPVAIHGEQAVPGRPIVIDLP